LIEPKIGQTNSDAVDSKTVVLTKERYIICQKLVKKYTSWLFDPSLNNPIVEIKRKTAEKNITMVLEHFCVEVKSNDEGIKDLNNISRVIMKRKKNQ